MIATAVYTLYKVVLAVMHPARASRNGTALLRIIRSLSLADAAGSTFALERMMIATFGEPNGDLLMELTVIAGAGASLVVFWLGLRMCLGPDRNGRSHPFR